MRKLRDSHLRFFLVLLLLVALACGPIGCGAEIVAFEPMLEIGLAAAPVISAVHDLHSMANTREENEWRRHWEWQMQHGGTCPFQPHYPAQATTVAYPFGIPAR